MKTVIPCSQGKIAPDFSSAPEFSLVEGSGYDLSVETVANVHGENLDGLVNSLAARGVERILAAGISTDAIKRCEALGLYVFHGASGSLSDGMNLIRLGILDNMIKGCGSGGCGSGGCGSGGCGSQEESSCGSGGCGCH